MSGEASRDDKIININDVLDSGSISGVETIRIMWAIRIAIMALTIATGTLFYGIYMTDNGLQTWATGLISAIAGAAISYGFNSRTS